MKKLLALLLAAITLTLCFAGCSAEAPLTDPEDSSADTADTADGETEEREPVEIRIASLKGPTTMGMIKLMDDNDNGKTFDKYNVTMYGAADEITALIADSKIDVACVPCNLAGVLYNKTEGAIQIAAINNFGVLYIVETGDSVKSIADLKGKTVYSTGKGTTPEYSLNFLLSKNGLEAGKDVTVEYKSEATEVAAALAAADDAIAMLPQPFVTTAMAQNEKLRIALDMSAEWDKVSPDSGLVTGVVIVTKDFAEKNPEALSDFLKAYEESSKFVNENNEAAAELVAKYGIVPKAAVAVLLAYSPNFKPS